MNDQNIICQDCNRAFTLNAGEQKWYEDRLQKDPKFRMPKRCKDCLTKRKNAQPPSPHSIHHRKAVEEVNLPPTPEERGVTRSDLTKTKPGGDEIRVVLATVDFEDLIAGRSVYCRTNKVRIILADIGFAAMRAAIDRAEIDKKLAAP